jgi:peptidoglycan/xylan/chitin deacetylase (PgdA/CDA1 family)
MAWVLIWYAPRIAARFPGWPGRIGRQPRPAFTVHRLHPDAPPHAVALTIDDGPDPQWTPAVLDVLRRHRVNATFFLIGERVAEHPHLVARILALGHTVGNHSLRHPYPFGALSPAELDEEIAGGQERIVAAGAHPRLFRAPAGGWSPEVLRVVARHGLTPADWTVDTHDWKEPGEARVAAALLRCRPGDILLCHDGGGDRAQTVAALDSALPRLRERGLTFVTL